MKPDSIAPTRAPAVRLRFTKFAVFMVISSWLTLYGGFKFLNSIFIPTPPSSPPTKPDPSYWPSPWEHRCKPPLPTFIPTSLPHRSESLRNAQRELDALITKRVAGDDIDSLILAVVTPAGTVFEKGYGVARANATEPSERVPPNSDTIYRIASISKMFTTLETLILRERGLLNWDDPVTKFFPNFTYRPYGWSEYLQDPSNDTGSVPLEPITLRQLASHMSGIGRDYPPWELKGWPHTVKKSDSDSDPERPTLPTTRKADVFAAMKEYPLIAPPYSYPVYSNTGFNLLGWSNAVAASKDKSRPISHADLLTRDVFEPLGLDGTFFNIPAKDAKRVAVSFRPLESDLDFTDAMNAAGGQYSSLNDLVKVMQTFLNPARKDALVSPYVMREWLRPLHVWSDGLTETGAPWEIIKLPDTHGRPQRLYQKGGNLASYHSMFAFNPQSGYGVVVLMAGKYTDAAHFVTEAVKIFQPVFDKLLEDEVERQYTGQWKSEDGKSVAVISMIRGSLWMSRFVLDGTDVLKLLTTVGENVQNNLRGRSIHVPLQGLDSLPLWSTERRGEFRMAIGRAALNHLPLSGCEPSWISIDPANSRGAPLDLLYFTQDSSVKADTLRVPSADVIMTRIQRSGAQST